MKLKFILFVCLVGIFSSCKTPKDVLYFQGIDNLSDEQLTQMSTQSYSTKITYDDLLAISVSAWDPAAVTPFNPPVFAYASQGDQPVEVSEAMYNYLVDKEGNIKFPIIGTVHVAGLSKTEVSNKLEELISKYVDKPLVNVQLLNFKVTLMGDFNRPGTYNVKNDRVSILDAIGMAGDLQLTANRTNIMVIREQEGKKQIHRMDITNPNIFESPCFYLQQNDVVYVEPIPTKLKTRNTTTRNFSVASSIISTLSVVASMIFSVITLSRN